MKTVQKSVLIWYSAQEMFRLVTAIDQYPEFLPWCDHAAILDADQHGMKAEVGISIGGIRQTFVTQNTHVDDREVGMKLVSGPFSKLDGRWLFTPVGDSKEGGKEQRACKVEFNMNYDFDNFALAALVGPVFDRIAGSLVDAFVKRAEDVYG